MRGGLLAGLLIVATVLAPGLAAAEIGRIKTVVGQVTVTRGKVATPAAPGLKLEVGDVLATGPSGQVGVTFNDNSRFAVAPNTRLALTEFEFDEATHRGRSLTTVEKGTVAFVSGQIAKENKDAMRIRTPTSLLAARGARFLVEVK